MSDPIIVHRCPKCQTVGDHMTADSGAGTLIISLACSSCQHKWTIWQSAPLRMATTRMELRLDMEQKTGTSDT